MTPAESAIRAALALELPAGEWEQAVNSNGLAQTAVSSSHDGLQVAIATWRGGKGLDTAAWIAACSPANLSAVLGELDAARAKLVEWDENVEYLLSTTARSVRVCEGGGPESLVMSLGVNYIALRDACNRHAARTPTTPADTPKES